MMYALIVVMFVEYGGNTIHVEQTTLHERYKDLATCTAAGQGMKPTSINAVSNINNLRVGFICVQRGTVKPL